MIAPGPGADAAPLAFEGQPGFYRVGIGPHDLDGVRLGCLGRRLDHETHPGELCRQIVIDLDRLAVIGPALPREPPRPRGSL